MIGGILHILLFIVTITTLAAMAQHSTTGFVFKTLVTGVSGWTNPGISFGIGLLTYSPQTKASQTVENEVRFFRVVKYHSPHDVHTIIGCAQVTTLAIQRMNYLYVHVDCEEPT
jgi:hypothetical protein